MLGFVKGRPVHVVVARDPDASICTIVTAYIPDPRLWDDDFKFRRTTSPKNLRFRRIPHSIAYGKPGRKGESGSLADAKALNQPR